MHRMGDVMVARRSTRKKATLADVVVKAFQTSEAKTSDRIFLADLAF